LLLNPEAEIDRLLHIAEAVREVDGVLPHQGDALPVDVEFHLLGDHVTAHLHVQVEVLLLRHGEAAVQHGELEGRIRGELAAVLDDAVGRIGDQARCGEKQDEQYGQWRQGIAEVLAVLAKIDGGRERHGRQLPAALGYARLNELALHEVAVRLLAQLQGVQQFVLHLSEVLANDGGGLVMRDDLAHVQQLHQRENDEARQHTGRHEEETPEEHRARRGAEAPEVLAERSP
jgi:hypothetical protein